MKDIPLVSRRDLILGSSALLMLGSSAVGSTAGPDPGGRDKGPRTTAGDQISEEEKMMTSRLGLYERYITAWSAMGTSERMSLLAQTVTEDIAYRDATVRCEGASALGEHLNTFQERSPGSSFRLLSMLSWGADGLAKWQIVDAEGEPGFSGYDAMTFAEDGRISSIVGFSETDKQRLK